MEAILVLVNCEKSSRSHYDSFFWHKEHAVSKLGTNTSLLVQIGDIQINTCIT